MTHKFLIQVGETGLPLHDFGFQMIEACNYKTWFDIDNPYVYSLWYDVGTTAFNDYIPIGSVEFVHQFLKQYYGIENIKPINIPLSLFNHNYLKRHCNIINKQDKQKIGYHGKRFVKSMDKIKSFAEIVDGYDINEIPEGNYLFSEVIDIQSEWRAFVYNKKLVGLQNYSGNFIDFPDVVLIENMIKDYQDCPPAYTLDVGINHEVGTFLIEVHNFYSCGLYGFADNRILPDMFEKSFKWIINKYTV